MPRPKRLTHFKIKVFQNTSGSKSYRVSGTKIDGTRIRQNFSEKADALQALGDLEAEVAGYVNAPVMKRTRLSAEQLADAEAAILGASGEKISKIIAHYQSLEAKALAKGASLDSALSFVDSHFRSEITPISILGAYEEFISTRPSGSPKTKIYYESSLRLLLKSDPNKPLSSFNVSDIERVLTPYSNLNSRRTYRRAFGVFFGWAVRHHYCLEDPCKRLDKLPKDMTQIAILGVDEIRRFISAALQYQEGVAVSAVVIGLFAGLRPSELAELKPEDVGSERIRVTGGKLRRTLKRTVPIPPNLAAWLEKYPFKGLPGGWDYKMKILKKATKAAKWVQDIVRHTSLSYQAERDRNDALTAFNCGTSPKMMDLHYRNSIDNPKLVEEFWDLAPAKLLSKKPEIELPTVARIIWPEKTALKKLVWEKPLVHAAATLGVSDVALRKRCVKLSIELPPQGYWLRLRRDRFK
jgi:integrase